jgi:hypothetical protein
MLSPLQSTKVSRNELKTNWFLSAKKAKRTQKLARNPLFSRQEVDEEEERRAG